MNLWPAIESLQTPASITVERSAQGAYGSDGIWVAGSVPTLTVSPVVVVPLTPEEQVHMPEGVLTREQIKIFSREELKTASVPNARDADVVLYKSRRFEVHKVQWWEAGEFYESFGVRLGQ